MYKNFQLIASTKNNLKIAEEQIVQDVYLQRQLFILGLKITKSAMYINYKCKLCLFEQDINRYIFISIRYTLIKTTTAGSQGYPLLPTNVGVPSFYGLIAASLRINQFYIKIYKSRLILVNVISCT